MADAKVWPIEFYTYTTYCVMSRESRVLHDVLHHHDES